MTVTMQCRVCHEGAPLLVRGVCARCDPAVHALRRRRGEWGQAQFDRYREATGREPLDNWTAWETWLLAHAPAETMTMLGEAPATCRQEACHG